MAHSQSNPRSMLRQATLQLALALAVLVGFVPGVVTPASAATTLYPDLKTLPPRDLRFASANVNVSGTASFHNVLQFSNTVYNAGQGPLDLRATIDTTLSPPSGPAYQRIYDDAGGYTSYPVGSMYYHAAHAHYHYEGWGAYQLWTKAAYDQFLTSGRTTGTPQFTGTKTTSCVMDEEFIAQYAASVYPAVYGGGCSLDASNQLHEGLSVGWGDTYDWYRFEQWIDLGSSTATLADGDYVLRSVTDPDNQLYESAGKSDGTRESPADNEGVTPFRVSGGQLADLAAPTGTVAINNIDSSTSSPSVSLSVLGRDDVSGVDTFRVSNDGVTYSPAYAYTTSGSVPTAVTWDLTDSRYGGTTATGTKTVSVQFHDRSGTWGPVESDTITLTTAAPPPPPPPSPTNAYGSAVYNDKPLAYWRLAETSGTTAADAMGPHPGTYANGPVLGSPSLVPSNTDASVAFDGVNDQVRVADAADLRPTTVSVEAWIRPTSLPAAGSFASVLTKAESYSLQFNGPAMEFTIMQSGTRRRLQAPAGTVAVGGTYHVVGTYDGTTQRLYVNNSQVASATLTGPASAATSSLFLGSWDGGGEFFSGRIDDAAVYGYALSGSQVSAHWNAAQGSTTSTMPVTVNKAGSGAGTVTSTPAGISCGTVCAAGFPSGSTVTLTAAPASGSVFAGWGAGACSGSTSTTCSFTAIAATSATATFQPATGTSYALSVTKGGSGTGTVTSSPTGISCGTTCSASFPGGTAVTLTAAPASGSRFTGWAGACSGTGSCSVTMNSALSVSASFEPATSYPVSVTKISNGSGTVTSSPAGISCGATCSASFSTGTFLTLTATAAAGSTFYGWGGACSGTASSCTLTVNAALSVTAKFRR